MSTQTVIQEQRLPGFQEQFLKDIFAQAQALKGTPQPFAPQQLAGLSEGQQRAISLAQQGVGSYQPFLDRAAQFAGPGGASQFMNPFENQVVQQTMQDIATQGQKAQAGLGGSGVASGAFGGSRFGVAQADLAGKTLEQQARSAGQLRQQGFQQAQQQMGMQDINTMMGIGSLQQRQQQSEFDVARANELARQALPFQQIGFMSDLFRGVPAMQSTYTTSQAPSPNLMTTGIGLLGAGLSGGFFNNMFGG